VPFYSVLSAYIQCMLNPLYCTCINNAIFYQTVWLVVFCATVLLGVDFGLAVGVGWSLLCLVLRTIL